MTLDDLRWLLPAVTAAAALLNVVIGLRMSALYSKLQAENSKMELTMLKQFVLWKDEMLSVINGKYVSAALVTEMKTSITRELTQIEDRMNHMDQRCERCIKEQGR